MTLGLHPFTLPDGQVHIAFSGGRTSGFMLHQIAEANGGIPSDRCHVILANTGRERSETLDFVQEVSERFAVPVTWLEYRYDNGPRAQPVCRETSNTDGKPFEQLLHRKRRLPNQAERTCTEELKVRTARRWLVLQGWKKWTKATGIRADEPHRLSPAKQPRETIWHPLAAAGTTKADIAAFWRAQPFDLALPLVAGRTIGGNCRRCFLKSEADMAAEIRDTPEDDWPDRMEAKFKGTFSKRYSMAEMRRSVETQGDWLFSTEDAFCQKSGGECT